jgi:putative transposase
LHCIWTLLPADSDFSTRWNLIKGTFSRSIKKGERVSPSRSMRGERGLWQRRFWEHLIRDENDLSAHIDYIHWNPVKHGWTQRVADWPHSSFQTYVKRGVYTRGLGEESSYLISRLVRHQRCGSLRSPHPTTRIRSLCSLVDLLPANYR